MIDEYFPAGQDVHDAELDTPNPLANLPAPQGVHGAEEPVADEYDPGLHMMQAPDPGAFIVVE
jgi:hypothetical protein